MKRFECKNCGHFRCVVFGTEVLSNKSFECKEKIFKTKWYEIDEEEEKEEIKETPSWCEIRSIVYHQNEYLTVVGEIGFTKVILSNGKQVSISELTEARLRPFNEKEMRELVGKAITYKTSEEVFLVTYFNKVHVGLGHLCLTAEDLLNKYTKVNGSPCGVYEHLENGEWMK
jgi:hypothetical protein